MTAGSIILAYKQESGVSVLFQSGHMPLASWLGCLTVFPLLCHPGISLCSDIFPVFFSLVLASGSCFWQFRFS